MSARRRLFATLGAAVLLAGVGLVFLDMARTSGGEVAQAVPGGLEAHVDARDVGFIPSVITAQRGRRLTITIRNQGLTSHTFTSPALGVDVVVPGTQTRTVTATLPGRGSFPFFCRYHISYGMRGIVAVT